MALAEGSPVVRESHAPNDAETSTCACGLLAAPFGAAFGGLEDRRLGNTMAGRVLAYGRREDLDL